MVLGDMLFTNGNKKEQVKYIKKAEKGKRKGRGDADRVTPAEITFMGKHEKAHSGRRCRVSTPGDERPGLGESPGDEWHSAMPGWSLASDHIPLLTVLSRTSLSS